MVNDIDLIDEYKVKMHKFVTSLFPDNIRYAVANYLGAYSDISEIRIRCDKPLAFTLRASNLITGLTIDRDALSFILNKMTDGNFYKNEEMMKCGFLSLPYSIRVGVAGDVFVSGGAIKFIKNVCYLNIRIPNTLLINVDEVVEYIKNKSFNTSILVIGAPCSGKTTLLRSLCKQLSDPPYNKRVSAIDTNKELVLPSFLSSTSCEYLTSYPKMEGIRTVIRYFNPEYAICDELCGSIESDVLKELHHSGVPIIASAHCDSFSSLKTRTDLSFLINNGIFDTVLCVKMVERSYKFEIKGCFEI